MAGLLDALNSEQGLLGLMLMQAGAAKPVRTGVGEGLLGALQGVQQHRAAQEDRDMRRQQFGLQQQQVQAQLDAQRRQQALEQQRRGYLGSLDASQGVAQPPSLPQALANGLSLQEFQALAPSKPPTITLKPGEQVFSPDGKPLFGLPAAPKEAAPSDLARLLSEMQALPPGSPARALYEQQLRKITTHAPPQTSISLGSPVPVMLPDGTHGLAQPANRPGEPPQLLRDPATGLPLRAASTEKLKQVPSNINTAISENRAALAKIDQAIAAVERNPGALGAKNYLPDPLIQRVDTAGVEPRALIADIGSLKIHDRSGAAVTAAEFPRLRPFIPAATDDPRVAAAKLRQLRAEYQALLEDARLTYSTENGYRPPPVFTAPTRENAARGAPGGLPPMDAIEAELRRRAGGG